MTLPRVLYIIGATLGALYLAGPWYVGILAGIGGTTLLLGAAKALK